MTSSGKLVFASRLGLGLAALGRPGYINLGHAADLQADYDVAAMETHCHAVLDAAWQAGLRYFDAARSYGRSEAFLARWLASRGIAPDAVTVGSKWGYTYTADWQVAAERHEVKDHSLAVLERQLTESQGLLGAYLRLYQIHSATLESGVLENRAVIDRLAQLRDEGVYIGLTLSGPNQAEVLHRALEVAPGGRRLFGCVQATWNLLEVSAGPALQAAHAHGLVVIVKEPLANGRLTPRNADPDFADKRQILEDTAARLRTTVDALALSVVLAQPWVDVVLSGAATVPQLRSNVAALDLRLDGATLTALQPLAETPHEYWAARGRLPWN